MLTEKDYCDYEICVALKELGYPLTSKEVRYEDKAVFVPGVLLYSAQKWLREEKNIGVFVSGFKDGYTFWVNSLLNAATLYQGFFDNQTGKKYETYEGALSEGIKEAVKILKEEQYDRQRNRQNHQG